MNNKINNCHTAARQYCGLFVVILCLSFSGCGSRGPALSEAARTFKREALDTIKRLSPAFIDILAQNNSGAVQAAFEKTVSDAGRGGSPIKFKIAILDRNGVKVAGGFRDTGEAMNFSGYDATKKVLQQEEIASEVLYLRGSQVCLVGAPLVREETIVGALVLGVLEADLKDQWQMTAKEFKEIDFN